MSAPTLPFIKRYAKAVCHLNFAKNERRLGLILGSGVSRELKIPIWKDLLTDLENELGYPHGNDLPESYRAEQLFQSFRHKHASGLAWSHRDNAEAAVASAWRAFVGKSLYRPYLDAGGALNEDRYRAAISAHPYLKSLAQLASQLQLVVTHNFDNALELAIDEDATSRLEVGRRLNAFWKPEPFLRREMVNIYHPNGYMPFARDVKGSDSVILTEASFADHLANTNSAEANFLLRHLSEKTWLIIGHSLADGTLKNALRMHANDRPGHVSYYVHWVKNGAVDLSEEQQRAIREANFETYNLITIFASSTEIAELLRLISLSTDTMRDEFTSFDIPSRYLYYISGAVSSGKSTVLGHLRDLITIEEWPGKMPATMNKPSTEISETEQREIDEKLERAIWKKNEEINLKRLGVVVVDRSPLDFVAFPRTKTETPKETANNRHETIFKRLRSDNYASLNRGQVILVRADPSILLERQLQRGGRVSNYDVVNGRALTYLAKQQELMEQTYKQCVNDGSLIDANRCKVAQTVKEVTRIIHFDEYKPVDFGVRLGEILAGNI